MRIKNLVAAVCLLFWSGSMLSAQVSSQRGDGTNVGFTEVSDKFVRNMKLLATLMHEAESQKIMNAVIGQAADLTTLYRSKNTGAVLEERLKRKDMMSERDSLKDSDQKKLKRFEDELKRRDPDNEFSSGLTQVSQTVGELQKQLGLIYTNDADQKDLIRIIQQHLTFYSSCLNKLGGS